MYLKKRFTSLLLLLTLLVGCGGAATNTTAPTPSPEIVVEATPNVASTEDENEEVAQGPSGPSGEEASAQEEASEGEASEVISNPESQPEIPGVPDMPTLSDAAITTDSGLQYEDIIAGEGAEAQAGDIASVHYTGWLEDGTVFDSSLKRNTPFNVPIGAGRVIPGWDEGLAGMKAGGERVLVIPPDLGYGEQATGSIPPNSTLIFLVQMLSIEEPPSPAAVEEYQTTENGVEYAILEAGEGDEVASGDIITFGFKAWLDDGTLFDDSDQGGGPAQFQLGQSRLPGLDEGIIGMKIGETRQLRIPPELAYGEEGAGDVIPPNATIIFEIALKDFVTTPKLVMADEYTTTDSGLEYALLQEGEGDEAKEGDSVSVHYSGWLEDGSLFDSSISRGNPFPFTIGQGSVIPGWEEGVVGMKVGETRQLRIPPDLAYGEQGFPPQIPANSTLIFNVELIQLDAAE